MPAFDDTSNVPELLHVGIDVGSTTTKVVVIDPHDSRVLFRDYSRHHAQQADSVQNALDMVRERFGGARIRLAVCGSGGKAIADLIGVPFIQEVVANALSVGALYPATRCAIELGGQDAKVVFFETDSVTGRTSVSDMRMNGSCAGGTGAFIDEIATLLAVPVEQFDDLASRGETDYDISGRCGVYAKTDIQPLLNQGVAKEDIALSTFHAIAKQTLGGLAQGIDICAPVIFEGGPCTFNPTLVRVFSQRLSLAPDEAIVPEHPETIVAFGAALSLSGTFANDDADVDFDDAAAKLRDAGPIEPSTKAQPFFFSQAGREAFEARLAEGNGRMHEVEGPGTLRVYLGVDSGSTTTKVALIDEDENLVDQFYANNEGEPLDVAREAFAAMKQRFDDKGIALDIIACGTTGYGEALFASALHADVHTVETVAHAAAATKHVPDATFVLDIGGQDMKALWLENGVITDIVVNEACSSGCGSFLENFASTLGIEAPQIAEAAFSSGSPANLGSRCTVFMNSSIITEQRDGKSPADIMAGLCRSIIENVFTKVVRVSNFASLGEHVVVQGGTFLNNAVVKALEDRIGRAVTRAPFPGLMGAIGAALIAKRTVLEREAAGEEFESTFIGLEAASTLSYTREAGVTCPFCANHCRRTVIEFADGTSHITGNRCEKGEVLGDPKDPAVRERLQEVVGRGKGANLFDDREELLFCDYDVTPLGPERDEVIGIPRVLSCWDSMPFWNAFWRSLGFKLRLSAPSTRKRYEQGLPHVTSDTVCFPAKLVHAHILDLAAAKVDRIFMPVITTVPSENTESTSQSMCAVVKGYPMVVRNSDDPANAYGVRFDDPLFHWYTNRDRQRQLAAYMQREFGIEASIVEAAIAQGDAAQRAFRDELVARGKRIVDEAEANGSYAVVLASRPYHNDALVNHGLPGIIARFGVPVLPPDALPGVTEVDLSKSRIDIVNNYHARMLSSAILAAESDNLEYVQLVSFGCGHDAYLSDEIVRLMHTVSGKSPLVLKVDESDAIGSLLIRVRSFLETVAQKRKAGPVQVTPLEDPYPVKFTNADIRGKIVLIPNTSHAFSQLMAAVFAKQGAKTDPLPIGRDEAIRLGKKYVHNDICFPAQVTIGEALAALESGKYDSNKVAIGTGKYIGDCRLTHYGALLRKALDDAGYAHVPIVTNDDVDYHNIHPGFRMSLPSSIRIAYGLPIIDALEELLRKIRPYELEPGSANRAFEKAVDIVMDGMAKSGARGALKGFERAIEIMKDVPYDRSNPRPTVLIVGEYLLNFHPGANHDIEDYLERNGMEVIEARMTDVIRKTYFYKHAQIKEYRVDKPFSERAWFTIADNLFELAHNACDRIAQRHPLYDRAARMPEIVQASDDIIHHTFDAGEGVLIPAEILHHAEHGCRAFVILQPFGCLPNHVVGRGIAKRLKALYPDAQILPLDYDPDVSFANIENRLQMLIMNAKA